jgi:hypothetical protein
MVSGTNAARARMDWNLNCIVAEDLRRFASETA